MEMTIGRRIAQLRREKGLTQDELSQMMEVSAQAVSKWENDQTCPDIVTYCGR
jgi:transcriptional regulator with XRE-family HTH domain